MLNKLKNKNIIFCVIMFLPILFFNKVLDNDFYFLYKYGEYVINNGFPLVEPFSMHSNLKFTMQQWLCAVIYYSIYNIFGKIGIILLLILLNILIIYLIYKTICLINPYKETSMLLTLPASILLSFFIYTRPFIFSYLLIILSLYFTIKYTKTNNFKYLLTLPIISILQINLHSSMWWFLFIIILPFFAEINIFNLSNVYVEKYNKIPLLITTVIMFFCGFLNPYGIDNILYVFKSSNKMAQQQIIEMATPTITNLSGIILTLTFFILLIIVINKKGTINIRYVFLLIGCIFLQIYALRNIPFLGLSISLFLADYFKDIDLKNIITNNNNIIRRLIIMLSAFLFAGIYFFISDITTIKTNNAYKAIDYLIDNNLVDNNSIVYTGYNDGSYAIFNNIKCYIDARMEIYTEKQNKKENYIDEYFYLQNGTIDINKFLNKYNFDFLIISKYDIMYNNTINNYSEIYTDEYCKILKNNKQEVYNE